MPWLSRNDFTASDFLHADDLNNLANDQRTWGGPVNGGGYVLSNVILEGVTTLAAGGVLSVFGRTGAVVAVAGDYTAAQVGAVPTTTRVIAGNGLAGGGFLSGDVTLTAAVTSVFGRTGAVALTPTDITAATGVLQSRAINTGTGLTGGGNLSADRTFSIVPDSVNQQVQVLAAGSVIGTRHAINFINGANITVAVADNIGSNRVDVTVSSTGGTGGMADPTTTLGDLIVRGLSAPTRLGVGADGQVLTADHTQATGLKWGAAPGGGAVASVFGRTGVVVAAVGDYSATQVTNAVDATQAYNNPAWITSLPWSKITNPPVFLVDPTLSKGDLIVHGAGTTRLPVGADTLVLTADSAQPSGLRWGALAVTSVFGRTGAVTAAPGDYSADQVTGAVATTRLINTSTGLTGGGNLSADRTFSVVPDTTNQQVAVLLGGTVIGTRHAINFINGANVALSISDNSTTNRIDLTVSSTGGAGGMVDPTTTVGDLLVRGTTVPQRLGVGANGQVLTADSAQLLGMRWATPAAGGPGSQTPWVSNIDAAAFNLNNVNGIGLNAVANPTTSHIYVVATGTEECFLGTNNNAATLASASVANDIGNYLRIRSYGTGHATTPGMGSLEAAVALSISANAAEVMRLTAGHVLIGTTTDDGLHLLQVNGAVKSAAGGFVFPDGTTQATAFTTGSSAVTTVFGRSGAVVALSGDYTAAKVTNAVDSTVGYANPTWITSLAWSKITGAPAYVTDPTTTKGDIIARTTSTTTRLGVGTDGQMLVADSTQATGLKWSAGPGQTPWLSNIDGATHFLTNAGGVAIGGASIPEHLSLNGYGAIAFSTGNFTSFLVHQFLTTSGQDCLSLALNYRRTDSAAGTVNTPSFKAVELQLVNDNMLFNISAAAGGQPVELMRLNANGHLGVGTSAPGATVDIKTSLSAQGTYQDQWWTTGNPGYLLKLQTVWDASGIYYKWINSSANTDYNVLTFNGANVGIATATPGAALDCAGMIRTTAGVSPTSGAGLELSYQGGIGYILGYNRTAGSYMPVNVMGSPITLMAGNVGVGIAAPTGTLHVQGFLLMDDGATGYTTRPAVGTARISGEISGTYAGSAAYDAGFLRLSAGGGTGAQRAYIDISGYATTAELEGNIVFGTRNIERMRINSTSVGIGITTPQATLEVFGASNNPSTSVYTNSIFTIHGSVGVGITHGMMPASPYSGWIQVEHLGGVSAYGLALQPLGGLVGIGTLSPNYLLDVAGDINCTGVHRVNGVALVPGGPTTWAIASPFFCTPTTARALSANYQNPYAVPVHVTIVMSVAAGASLSAYVGPTTSPTTLSAVAQATASGAMSASFHFIVLPGYYYMLTAAGSVTIAGTIEWK